MRKRYRGNYPENCSAGKDYGILEMQIAEVPFVMVRFSLKIPEKGICGKHIVALNIHHVCVIPEPIIILHVKLREFGCVGVHVLHQIRII